MQNTTKDKISAIDKIVSFTKVIIDRKKLNVRVRKI